MLSSEIPLRRNFWLVRVLAFLLSEAFLGFLAIIAVALTLFPMLFAVSPGVAGILGAAQWLIVGLFAVEYALALAWSGDRHAFLRDAWRWLDLITVVVPLATVLPSVSNLLRSSMVFRLIRLIRIVTFSVRASGMIVRHEARRVAEATIVKPARVTRLHRRQSAEIAWPEFWEKMQTADESWYHIEHPSAEDVGKIASAAGITAETLQGYLTGTGYPHIETVGSSAGFFAWVPELRPNGDITRCGLFFLVGEKQLLSITHNPTNLLSAWRATPPPAALETQPFAERVVRLFFGAALQQNERVVGAFTTELRGLEDVPVRDSRTEFFERTFRLKKELSAAQADLWRLKSLLTELAETPSCLPGVAPGAAAEFHRMADDAAFLHEAIVTLREGVLSLIDLHINVVSFDMNRIMRLLAVISALGLIPAVVGGLLGMNVAGNPWAVTLPQVAFGVCLGMVLGLYFFFVKGWLR
jgi:Mg2+ and Co2+ transporter CorA